MKLYRVDYYDKRQNRLEYKYKINRLDVKCNELDWEKKTLDVGLSKGGSEICVLLHKPNSS